MLRILFLAIVFNLVSNYSEAQIIVDNSIFPEAGDTLFTTFAANPEIADVGDLGGDQTWNFAAFQGANYSMDLYLDASEGSLPELFPDADLVVKSFNVQDVYIDVQENKIIELGRTGTDPVGFGFDANVRYTEMPVIQRAPLVYGSSFATDLEINFAISTEELPDSLGLNIPLVDSIGITIVSEVEGEIDAWGTMIIPDGEFEVLRLNNITESTTSLSAYSQLLGWITIDPATLPLGELGQLFEPMLVNSYVFYSNTSKEPIATITVDENGDPVAAQYKGRDMTLGNSDTELYELRSYPNPTSDLFTVEFGDLPSGIYTFELLDITGSLLDKSTIDTNRQDRYDMDLRMWSPGIFTVVARNQNGQLVYSDRVILTK